MTNINVVMDYLTGGALIGLKRIANKLPQYEWKFSTEVLNDADIVLYMNNNRHYERAKQLGVKHIVQRKTGIRSLSVPEPSDLKAVICGSKVSFNNSQHEHKILIYNGVDLDYINKIEPKINIDLLIAESRIGKGQAIHLGCEYALNNKRHLTILGNGKGLDEDTYDKLRKKYPQHTWIGRVSPNEALFYIKCCKAIIISNSSHGVANQIIEAVAMSKEIITLCDGLEIPPKDQLDINITAIRYNELFKGVLNGRS
jgi:hypothetical protein